MILEPGAKIGDRVHSISIGGKEKFEGDDVGNLWNRNDVELTILAAARVRRLRSQSSTGGPRNTQCEHPQLFKIKMSFAERAAGSDCTKAYISAIS
jgi:hypothetical protein